MMKRSRSMCAPVPVPKRRKLEKSSKSFHINKLTGNGLFDDVKVLIIPGGIGPVRYNILKNHVKQRGGKIQHRLHNSTTHIITSLSLDKVFSLLQITSIPSSTLVVSPEWISDCMKQQKLVQPKFTSPEKIKKKSTLPHPISLSNPIPIPSKKNISCIPTPTPSPPSITSPFAPSPDSSGAPTFNVNYSPFPGSPISRLAPTPEKIGKDTNNTSFSLAFMSPCNISYSDSDADSAVSDLLIPDVDIEDDISISDDEWLSYLPPSSTDISASLIDPKKRPFNPKILACQKQDSSLAATFMEGNKNKHVTDKLEEMENLEKNLGEPWRALAYRKATTALKKLPYEITSIEQAQKVRGIGEKISKKIVEIIETGSLQRLTNPDQRTQAFQMLSKVWGAGPETIKKWLSQGFFTLEDLQANPDSLNNQQRIGVRYYNDFISRIPRQEVTHIFEHFCKIVNQLDKNILIEICGSYRRGALDCGDIDILITDQKGSASNGQLTRVISELHKEKFLSEDLSFGNNSDKYMGVCYFPAPNGSGIHRRIDIQFIPLGQWPLSILYFTGSAHFNRSMRLWARKNGFSLCEKSLKRRFVLAKGPTKQRESEKDIKGEAIPVRTEKDVFNALGLSYIPPSKRNV